MNRIFFITFVALSLFMSFSVSAQDTGKRKHFDREAFQAKRNAFIMAEVGLTPDEAALFIPLSDELKKKKFEEKLKKKTASKKPAAKKKAAVKKDESKPAAEAAAPAAEKAE